MPSVIFYTAFILNNNVLWVHKSVKYLGVIVDENLSWSEQVRNVSQKSLCALAAIRRVSLCLSSDIATDYFIQCFYSALPHLLLCSLSFLSSDSI